MGSIEDAVFTERINNINEKIEDAKQLLSLEIGSVKNLIAQHGVADEKAHRAMEERHKEDWGRVAKQLEKLNGQVAKNTKWINEQNGMKTLVVPIVIGVTSSVITLIIGLIINSRF